MARITIEPKKKTRWPYAALILLLAALIANSYSSQVYKTFAVVCAVCVFVLLFTKKQRLSAVNNVLGYTIGGYILLAAASLFYGVSASLAIDEFARLFIAFVFFIGAAFYVQTTENGMRNAITAIAWSAVPIGILSVDAASTNLLMRPLRLLSKQWDMVYADGGYGFYNRLTTIFDNANIYAGFMAVAVLLSFYLALTAASKKQRIACNILLLLNTTCYLLAISIGSIFFFLLACVLYLVVVGKGSRLSLFLLMLWDAICSLIVAFVCMAGLYGESYTQSPIPLLALAAGSVLFAAVDISLRDRLCVFLPNHKKAALSITIAFLLFCLVFVAVALHWNAPYTLTPGSSISRSTNLSAGEYTLTVSADAEVDVVVNVKGQRELLTNTATTVAAGSSNDLLTFTVPEDTKGVFVICSLPDDCGYQATINEISYEGQKSGTLMLRYRLLPSFIANRLQELTASGTAGIRTMFFRDGLKLWLQRPILGGGLSTFNNGIYGVQDFSYGTKYAHNHYIQMLCDLGVIGFAIFIVLLASVIVMIWRGAKKSPAIAAVFAAACFQIFGQALTDLTWSAGAPLLLFFVLFGLISAYFGDTVALPKAHKKQVGLVFRYAAAALSLVFAVLFCGNIYGSARLKSGDLSLEELPSLCVIDSFNRYSYQLTYLMSSLQYADDPAVQQQAASYAAQMSDSESFSVPIQLAAYFSASGNYTQMLEQIDRSITLNRSDSSNWSSIFNLFETKADPVDNTGSINQSAAQLLVAGDDTCINDALSYYDKMCEVSAQQWDDLTLEPNNLSFLGKLMAVKQIDPSDFSARLNVFSSMVYDSDYAVDINADEIPDFLTGEYLQSQNGTITTSHDTQIIIPIYLKAASTYQLRIETDTPEVFSTAYFADTEMPYTIEDNAIVTGFTIPDQLTNQEIELIFDVAQGAHITRISMYQNSAS